MHGWGALLSQEHSLSQGWTRSSSDLTKGGNWTGGPGQPGNHSFPSDALTTTFKQSSALGDTVGSRQPSAQPKNASRLNTLGTSSAAPPI